MYPWLYTEIIAWVFHSWAEFQFDTTYLVTCVRVPKSRDLIDCSTSIQPMYWGTQRERRTMLISSRQVRGRSQKEANVISAH